MAKPETVKDSIREQFWRRFKIDQIILEYDIKIDNDPTDTSAKIETQSWLNRRRIKREREGD